MDVRETRDHALVIMHDATVDRTTNGKGAVADLTLAEIKALDPGSSFGARYAGERVPTLDEVLALCWGRMNIYLDFKSASVAAVAAAIREHDMTKQVVVYGDLEEVAAWKQAAPEIPVMISPEKDWRHEGGIAEGVKGRAIEVLDGNVWEWTAALVKEAHA